jgi:hypothetical protein
MASQKAELTSLVQCLDLLIAASRPARARSALRNAIIQLAGSAETPRLRRALETPPRRPNGAAIDWERLKPRLHAIVASSGPAERAAIAAELGISPSTLRNCISTTRPGAAVAARIEQWLQTHAAPAKLRKVSEPERFSEPETDAEPDEDPAEPAAPAATAPNGANGKIPKSSGIPTVKPDLPAPNGRHRLSSSQRERLNFLVEHMAPSEIRSGAQCSLDIVREAIGGREFALEIVERLRAFVDQG